VKPPSARRPVFLDATGQRRRTLRRAGAFLAVPIVGYLILMSSSLLGGPSLDTPLIPQPDAATKSKHLPQITPPPAAIKADGSTPTPDQTEPSDDPSSEPSDTPSSAVPTVAPTTPGVVPTAPTTTAPSGSPTAPPGKQTTTPTTTRAPTPATTHNGNKPTTPPGHTKTPGQP